MNDPDRGRLAGLPVPLPVRVWIGPFGWLLLAAVALFWLARPVLGPFVVAGALAYAFSPLVTRVERRTGMRRVFVVALGYVLLVVLLVAAALLLARPVNREIAALSSSGPDTLAVALRQLLGRDTIDLGGQRVQVTAIAAEVQRQLTTMLASPGDAVHLATQVGDAALQGLLALIVAFYLLVDGARMRDAVLRLLPSTHQARAFDLVESIHEVLAKWLRGQLLLIALVAFVVYLALGPVLHLPYALAIGVITGLLEIIPLVGPLIATAIAATDAFAHGGAATTAIVVVFYFAVRQVEDQLVMPVVIGRVVHLHPVVTIFAVLVGLSVGGVLGGLLGVPAAAAINVVFHELYPQPPAGAPPATEATSTPTPVVPPSAQPPGAGTVTGE